MSFGTPLWWDARPAPRPSAPRTHRRFDIAIVGAGFAGLSSAYHLLGRRPGARVALLEAGRLGAGASGRTTGMLGPGVGQSLSALVRRHGPTRAGALYRATLAAVRDTQALLAFEHVDCDLHVGGQLVVARSPGGRRRLRTQASLMQSLGLPHETLDDAALAARLHLLPGREQGSDGPAALRLPEAATLHPVKLLAALAQRVEARGGEIYEQARVAQLTRTQPPRLVLENGGEWSADEVVIAVAGYAPALGIQHGRILPVHLQVLASEPLSSQQRAGLAWAGREGVIEALRVFNYFRLTADGRVVFGGGRPRYRRGMTADGPDAEQALADLTRRLRTTLPGLDDVRVSHAWTGLIGYVLDALPAIAWLPERPGVLHVGGWCGHGVALALAAGAWVATLMCERAAAPQDLPWFRAHPPLLPGEWLRQVGFQASVRAMEWLDRWA